MQNGAEPAVATDPIGLITEKVDTFVDGFFYQLPNIAAGMALVLLAWGVGALAARAIRDVGHRRDRVDLGTVLASLAKATIIALGVMFAAAIIFPSVNPGDVFTTLGIGSVAIGFAFKDILQNLLAGLLLLIRRPFRRGDQIVVKEFEGTVEHIENRATLIKTYDGRRVIIPNSDIYTSPVTVNTAFPLRRDEYDVGIGYGDGIAGAAAAFLEAMRGVEGVRDDPAPECLPWELAESTINLKLRWWAASGRSDQVRVRSNVILAVAEAARTNEIDLAFPTQVVLFHDQTEETDGDRTRQREGWPAGKNPPRPRVEAKREREASHDQG